MRGEIAQHKPPGGVLDAKLLRGGLVDLEFLVHYLQLRDHKGLTPDLGAAIDALAGAGLIAGELRAAHDLMTRLLVSARLLAPDLAPPPQAAALALARACRQESLAALMQEFANARHQVAR